VTHELRLHLNIINLFYDNVLTTYLSFRLMGCNFSALCLLYEINPVNESKVGSRTEKNSCLCRETKLVLPVTFLIELCQAGWTRKRVCFVSLVINLYKIMYETDLERSQWGRSRDSSVGLATWLRVGRSRFDSWQGL
jgi:hypothetical protein